MHHPFHVTVVTPITTSVIFAARRKIYGDKIFITSKGKKKKLCIRVCKCHKKFWARETFNHMTLLCPDCYIKKHNAQPPSYCTYLSPMDKVLIDVFHKITNTTIR